MSVQTTEAKKEEFRTKGIPSEEVWAYHGTQPSFIESICKNNLNVIKRTTYGHGYYFSEFPEFSGRYGQGLILFKTLPGNEYIGHHSDKHFGPNAIYQSRKIHC